MLYDFTAEYSIQSHFLAADGGGVCHSVIRDNYAAPGKLIIGTDSHTPTCGIRGALGLAVGATEAAAAIEAGAWGGIAVPPGFNANYTDTLTIDLNKIVPAVALPHNPGNYMPLADLPEPVPVHKVFVGSCTGGLLYDIQLAADLLRGNHVADWVKLYVQPSSNPIYAEAEKLDLLDIIREAGGVVLKPACGGCIGQGEAAIGDGENGVWNSNRNYQGRVGSAKGNVYIASTRAAVLAAIHGALGV